MYYNGINGKRGTFSCCLVYYLKVREGSCFLFSSAHFLLPPLPFPFCHHCLFCSHSWTYPRAGFIWSACAPFYTTFIFCPFRHYHDHCQVIIKIISTTTTTTTTAANHNNNNQPQQNPQWSLAFAPPFKSLILPVNPSLSPFFFAFLHPLKT